MHTKKPLFASIIFTGFLIAAIASILVLAFPIVPPIVDKPSDIPKVAASHSNNSAPRSANFDTERTTSVADSSLYDRGPGSIADDPTDNTSTEIRVALVIGNNSYSGSDLWRKLRNAINDAKDISNALKRLNFEVILKTDLTHAQMSKAIEEFTDRLVAEKTAGKHVISLFYYSGHGLGTDNDNYLIPIDFKGISNDELKQTAIDAQGVVSRIGQQDNYLNIIILDACRNSPEETSSRGGLRGEERGFNNKMTASNGTLIAFATAAGATASDGDEANGLYAKYLLKVIEKPLKISDVFNTTSKEVEEASKGEQIPWTRSELTGKGAEYSLAKIREKIFRDKLKSGSDGPEMVTIPAGEFDMGDSQGKGEADEKPVHKVSVAEFAIGRNEVTVAEFTQFMKKNPGYKTDAEKGEGCEHAIGEVIQEANWKTPFPRDIEGNEEEDDNSTNNKPPKNNASEQNPVTCVSWNDAVAYAKWLSQETGYEYSLPSEAHWEYAARAGTKTNYWWGNEIQNNQANCYFPTGWKKRPTSAHTYSNNSFDLYDTVGNVWEWVADPWHDSYEGAPTAAKVWESSEDAERIVRGGSFNSQPEKCAVSNRAKYPADKSYIQVGFRVMVRLGK